MSWLFSQALVADYLHQNSSGGEQFALLNVNLIPQAYCAPDRMTEFSHLSRFGMTFKPLTVERGEELLMLYRAVSRVRHFPQQQGVETLLRKTCGRQCAESSKKCSRDTCLLKMSPSMQLNKQRVIYWRTATTVNTSNSVLPTWVRIIFGTGFGYLHTPTCTANFAAPSMQKHPSCRNFVTVFGKPSPTNFEHLMGWPVGWTDLKPLEMDKFHSWQQSHFLNCGTAYANP